jgi:hypothetical protein
MPIVPPPALTGSQNAPPPTPSIRVHQWPEEHTRAPNNSCYWVAEAVVDGVSYGARSRRGAPHELARVLVAAGIGDAPMRGITAGLRGETTYRSFHAMAGYSFKENARTPVRRARYRPAEEAQEGDPAASKQGVKAPAGVPVATGHSPHQITSPG